MSGDPRKLALQQKKQVNQAALNVLLTLRKRQPLDAAQDAKRIELEQDQLAITAENKELTKLIAKEKRVLKDANMSPAGKAARTANNTAQKKAKREGMTAAEKAKATAKATADRAVLRTKSPADEKAAVQAKNTAAKKAAWALMTDEEKVEAKAAKKAAKKAARDKMSKNERCVDLAKDARRKRLKRAAMSAEDRAAHLAKASAARTVVRSAEAAEKAAKQKVHDDYIVYWADHSNGIPPPTPAATVEVLSARFALLVQGGDIYVCTACAMFHYGQGIRPGAKDTIHRATFFDLFQDLNSNAQLSKKLAPLHKDKSENVKDPTQPSCNKDFYDVGQLFPTATPAEKRVMKSVWLHCKGTVCVMRGWHSCTRPPPHFVCAHHSCPSPLLTMRARRGDCRPRGLPGLGV